MNQAAARQTSGRRSRTREILMQAGRQLLASRSLEAISIEEIVQTARLAKGTFYNHFQDKDELALAVYQHFRGQIEASINIANLDAQDPAMRIARGVCVYARFVVDEPLEAGVLAKVLVGDLLTDEASNEGLIADMGSALKQGRFNVATVEIGVLCVIGHTHALMSRLLRTPTDPSAITIAQQVVSIMLRGLGIRFEESFGIAAQASDYILRLRADIEA